MDAPLNLFLLGSKLMHRSMTLDWLREIELIPSSRYCKKHKRWMTMLTCTSRRTFGSFRCTTKNHVHEASVAENTWFERCHISLEACIIITYAFAMKFSYEQTIRESSIVEGMAISRETIADRFSFCREVCLIALDDLYTSEGQIGGPGTVVEIDECKIGRRKYERGRVVERSWILGMIEREGDGYRLEICPDNKRDAVTLITLIQKHVKVGTAIYTDCWKGYLDLSKHGYEHQTVNHSENFVDPELGTHTQNVESSWRCLRQRLSRGGIHKDHLADHLCEYLWRREIKRKSQDPFTALIREIKKVYPGKTE